MTVNDIAKKLNVTRVAAYGLVQFMVAKGIAKVSAKEKKDAGTKGKGSNVYTIDFQGFEGVITALKE